MTATVTETWIPAASFRMGSDGHHAEEGPARTVEVDGFWIDTHAVTNRQFAVFVADTGYTTVAEHPLDPAAFPAVQDLSGGSMVFQRTRGAVDLGRMDQWWEWTPGASWKHPEGPGSGRYGVERLPCPCSPRQGSPRRQSTVRHLATPCTPPGSRANRGDSESNA